MSAGSDFVKKIGTVGCILFLLLAVLVTMICLTSGRDPIPGYESGHDAQYWSAHPQELCRELEENVFPKLEGNPVCSGEAAPLTVTIADGSFAVTRSAILRYFDRSLFVFERAGL